MSAANFNLAIEAGATFTLPMVVRDGPTQASPVLNLADWTPRMQIRQEARALGVLLDCRPTNGRITVADAANGKLLISIPAEDTARLDLEDAVYDVIITHNTSGEVRRLLQGKADVSPAVTR